MVRFVVALAWLALVSPLLFETTPAGAVECTVSRQGGHAGLPHPVLFVTQFPIAADFATIGSTFANHQGRITSMGRGGDLWILYPDGSLCNITREGGFGESQTFQGASSIAVRDPSVHWQGDRALFAMIIGAGEAQHQGVEAFWQLYEVTGLGQGEPIAITRVANQPASFDNITPVYGPDGRILFTTDRPRTGEAHHYPQLDEYESTPTVSGLWALDPGSGELTLFDHAPSGVFTPIVDSFGRILFSRWDHLQRDQQADNAFFEAFDFASEAADAAVADPVETFPEPRIDPPEPFVGLRFNHFLPWMTNADGTEHETLEHIGRHELHSFFHRNRTDDPNVVSFDLSTNPHSSNTNDALNFFHIAEDPSQPGRYYGTLAPEFGTHASGGLIRIDLSPGADVEGASITFVTHEATQGVLGDGVPVPPEHSGHYRDPLVTSHGLVLAAHTFEARAAANEGSRENPDPRYDFRLRILTPSGEHLEPSTALTGAGGLARSVSYFDPSVLVQYDGPFWEMSPVEVRARPAPPLRTEPPLASPEAQVFAQEGVDEGEFRAYLAANDLALVVSRDVTTRDVADRQQPYNLRVAGGTAATISESGTIYDVQYLQFFQGEQVRGYGARTGRRVLAREMEAEIDNPPSSGAPGSVDLAADGSMAAMIPAHRAMSWQLTSPENEPVVRERYWLTFQAGEIRVCASCHGLNSQDQVGDPEPSHPPEALRALLRHWKATNVLFADGFESGQLDAWSSAVGN